MEIRCFKCKASQVYTLKNGTKVCRKCGYRETIEEQAKNDAEKKYNEVKRG